MKAYIRSLAVTACLFAANAQAQDYPARAVNVIVGFPAGQSVDVAARLVMENVATQTRSPFVIHNKPGAGGIIGTDFVAKAPADGYTLLFGSSSSLVINTELYKSLPYNTLRDFSPVSMVAQAPMFLVVNKDLPVENLQEFIAYAKQRPGALNYASAGNGLTNHLVMEMFRSRTGLELLHVPYKGSAAGLTDLVGGRIQAMFDAGPGALPLYRDSKVKILAVSSADRSRAAPEIPTLRESDVDLAAVGWVGLMAPTGTDASIVAQLARHVASTLANTAMSDKLIQLGFEPHAQGPSEFRQTIESELPVWGKAVRESGATVD